MLKLVSRFIHNAIYRFYCDIKLKNKLIISFSVFIIFAIAFIGLSSYHISMQNMVNAEKKSLMQSVHQLNNTLDFFLETYMNKSEMIFNNTVMQQAILKYNSNLIEAMDSQKKICNILVQVKNDFRYPEMKSSYYYGGNIDIRLYVMNKSLTEFGGEILHIDTIKDKQWYKDLYNSSKQYFWQYECDKNAVNVSTRSNLIYNRKMVDFNTAKDIGLLRLYIPFVRFEKIFTNNINNPIYSVIYVDQNYNLITGFGRSIDFDEFHSFIASSQLADGINNINIKGEKYIVSSVSSSITDWKLFLLVPLRYITQKTNYITAITVLTILVSFAVCVFIATLISSIITKRIDILVLKTNSIRDGNFSIVNKIKGYDEIGQLDKNFNSMIIRINNLIENEYKSKIAMNRVKCELLQEQINPHLLYNTLTMISMIARESNQTDLLNICNNLVSFYRGILNKGKIISSIREEIDMVKRYIDITKFVYRLDIETYFEIEEELLDLYSIKLFLQPILENSIIHGIKPKGGGFVSIYGRRVSDSIEFVVTDDGVGIDEDTLVYLNSVQSNEAEETGYGISNVIRRIHLFFGSEYGVKFESSIDFGTTVVVTIPALSKNEMVKILDGKHQF